MKICVITSVYALSETDRNGSFLVETHRYLARQGHDIHVFAPSYEGCASHTVDGIPVHRFRYFFRRFENLTHGQGAPNRIRNPLYLFIAAFYIVAGLIHAVRFCRRERFDVLHVHWPFPHGIWGYVAGRLSGTPVVLTFHGAELLLAKKFPFVRTFLRHALRHAKDVMCNSSYTAGEIRKLSARPVNIIPYGVTVAIRPPERRIDKDVKEILFVGRLIPRKGLDFLIAAMPAILAEVPAHLHVAGDGNRREDWEKLAASLGLKERITFHGVVSNERLEALYASADAFVLPAIVDERGDTEGLGIVLVEALSFGVPVVASHVGGIPDVIIDRRTGLLVPEQDSAALAGAIVSVLTDRALADELARAGLEHARTYFDWERIIRALEAVYRNAVRPAGLPNKTAYSDDQAAKY